LSVINEVSNSFVTTNVLNFKPSHSDALDNGSDNDVVIVRPIGPLDPRAMLEFTILKASE
jgi:hypothetical protein